LPRGWRKQDWKLSRKNTNIEASKFLSFGTASRLSSLRLRFAILVFKNGTPDREAEATLTSVLSYGEGMETHKEGRLKGSGHQIAYPHCLHKELLKCWSKHPKVIFPELY